MCLKIYHLDPIKFLSAPGSADIEKGEGMCNTVHGHAKTNNKYMTGYDKESSYFNYWDVNNLYGWEMLQKFLVKKFEWIEDISQFNENFIRNYNKESDGGYFLKVDAQYLEKLH